MINYERNAKLRQMIAEETKEIMTTQETSTLSKIENKSLIKNNMKNTHNSIVGICMECINGRYSFNFSKEFCKKHAGKTKEVVTELPCKCGSHFWMITIPSRDSILDQMLD